MRSLVFLLAIVAAARVDAASPTLADYKEDKASEAAAKEAAGAKDAKMAAVNKVVTMLEDLRTQVLDEGEKEAKTYNEFACFCKTTMKGKSEAISKGKDAKTSITAAINLKTSERENLDTAIGNLEGDIAKAKEEMKKLTTTSDESLAVYTTNEADLASAIFALEGAIKELKSSKKPSLMQIQGLSKTLEKASLMADALGLSSLPAFLQKAGGPEVEMEDYKFHSDDIVGSLEKLLTDFTKQKNTVDADEVKRVKTYDMAMQDLTDLVKAKEHELAGKQEKKDHAIEAIESNNQELTTVSSQLLDDMEYLSELSTISSEKAKTWDQRSKVRADELSALTAAIDIVKGTVATKTKASTIRFAQTGVTVRMADAVATSESSMEAIEAAAEEAEEGSEALGFLQRRLISRHSPADKQQAGKQAILDLLRNKGQQLHSTMLTALAGQVAATANEDVFAKVKVLIQELIERLLQEAANEANQKGWCDKALADATQKRTYAAEEIDSLNSELASLEAKLDEYTLNIKELDEEIKAIIKEQKENAKLRSEEKDENHKTVQEAEAGLSAVNLAIDILTKFYATAAKEKVALELVQGPADDMPDSGFEAGEAYKGAGGEAGGIVGMLEVIQSDFTRTIKETEKAEDKAEEEYLAFQTESGKSRAEKEMALAQNTHYKDDTELKIESDTESLKKETTILKTSIEELMELQTTCIDTGMTYAERVARRQDEIESLKKALCILNAYASYGPEGLADAC